MEDYYKLSEVKAEEISKKAIELAHQEIIGNCTLYWEEREPNGDIIKTGFYFVVTKFISALVSPTDSIEETFVEIVVHGYAYFDGIRHAYWFQHPKDPDANGYDYYPDMKTIFQITNRLHELEVLNCFGVEMPEAPYIRG